MSLPTEPGWSTRRSLARHVAALVLVLGLAGAAVAWTAETPLSGAVIATGTLVVESSSKKVQHPTGQREINELHVPVGRNVRLTLSSEASQTRGWAFTLDGEVRHLRPASRLDCSDGQVLHDWCLAGLGLAWRSWWEVGADVQAGRLVRVLDDFAAPPNGIYAVFAQRKHQPLRLRLWIDFLKETYGQPAYWRAADASGA